MELTRLVCRIAAEGDFRWSIGKHVENLAVSDVAYLMILEDRLATLVTCHVAYTFAIIVDESVRKPTKGKVATSRVGLADVAVNSAPAVLALALLAIFTLSSLFPVGKRVAF